jgi:hypothetical protein
MSDSRPSRWSSEERTRRRWAEETARRLAGPDGLRLARLLQAGGGLGGEPARPAAQRDDGGPRPIHVWAPEERDGALEFVRPAPAPWGDHYAARRRIPAAKTTRRRVCWFGESAAAGYLYAPHLTPAGRLQEVLAELTGPKNFEVVDLARTDERLATLASAVEASIQLDPDVLVIYAGNNWALLETPELSPWAPGVGERQRLGGELSGGGLEGAARRARLDLVARVQAAFERIARAAAGRKVILLLPEVNLADWRSPQPTPWLPGNATARWHELLERAAGAERVGNDGAVEEAAWKMIELDGGLNPTAFGLLARALLRRGAPGEAGEAVEAARSEVDALHAPLLGLLDAPRAGSTARELLTRAAAEHGFAHVDLRAVFAELSGDRLPGRNLFLDYCHLDARAIGWAAAATAAEILSGFPSAKGAPAPLSELASLVERLPEPRVMAPVEAVARLGAAIHTAHRQLPLPQREPHGDEPLGDVLDHWVRSAYDASPGVAHALLELVDARSAPVPAPLTAAQRANWGSAYPLSPQHGWLWDYLDADLLLAVGRVLHRAGVEWSHRPVAEEIAHRLVARLEPGAEGLDLAKGDRFLRHPLARFLPEALATPERPARAHHRAPWPETTYCLVTGGRCSFELKLTARLPPIPGWSQSGRERQGTVKVTVNGERVGEMRLGERWRREVLRVGRRRLKPGINHLRLAWPALPSAGTEALAEATRRLENGIAADLHPVFGEVFSLVARPR